MLFYDNSVHEDETAIWQEVYPFRFRKGLPLWEIFQGGVFKWIFATMTFGVLPLMLLMFITPFLASAQRDTWALMMLGFYLLSLLCAMNWRRTNWYDKLRQEFGSTSQLFQYRIGSHHWPLAIFQGISFGSMMWGRMLRNTVIRIRCIEEGFLVDRLFTLSSGPEARQVAERLASATGLSLDGEETTGTQHELNDLRGNGWMVSRLKRRAGVGANKVTSRE